MGRYDWRRQILFKLALVALGFLLPSYSVTIPLTSAKLGSSLMKICSDNSRA